MDGSLCLTHKDLCEQNNNYVLNVPCITGKFQQKCELVQGIPSILDKKAFLDFGFYL